MKFEKNMEAAETSKIEKNDFKEIKPQAGMTIDKAKEFVKNLFEGKKPSIELEKLEKLKEDYIEELKSFSEFKETLPDEYFDVKDLRKVPTEETKKLKEEFHNNTVKENLKKQWEKEHGIPWPKYEHDVYVTNKDGEVRCIREAGMDYDAHHIQPLGLGGKNEVSNITPMHADVHFDHKGIHQTDSAYDKIDKLLGGDNK